jgi:hypothetical protein
MEIAIVWRGVQPSLACLLLSVCGAFSGMQGCLYALCMTMRITQRISLFLSQWLHVALYRPPVMISNILTAGCDLLSAR